jgi:hypothetical protein
MRTLDATILGFRRTSTAAPLLARYAPLTPLCTEG